MSPSTPTTLSLQWFACLEAVSEWFSFRSGSPAIPILAAQQTPGQAGEFRIRAATSNKPIIMTRRPLGAGSGVGVVPVPGPDPDERGGHGELGLPFTKQEPIWMALRETGACGPEKKSDAQPPLDK